MKSILVSIVAAVVLLGCCTTPSPEPPTVKAPDISIHKAAESGNIEAVKQHLAAGTDVNAKGENGWTPLRFAANKKVAELLLANGADVNTKDTNGWTPLHQAAFKGHRGATSLFIANGADVNAKNGERCTPLHLAVGEGHKEIAELLVTKGADVNAKDDVGKLGRTPLDWTFGKKETADLLRKHGAKTGEELKAEGR